MKTTVYLLGPMTGLPKYNFPAFTKATAHLRRIGLTVLNPAENEITAAQLAWPARRLWLHCMHLCLQKIGTHQCEAAVILPGWQSSNGASTEALTFPSLELPSVDYRPRFTRRTFDMALEDANNPERVLMAFDEAVAARRELLKGKIADI